MTPSSDSDHLAERLLSLEIELIRRAPESDIEPTLDRVEAVLHALGSPQLTFPSIHVAGTNGKSSTTRMIDALLAAFGLRTGCFTSPHLQTVRERILIDGELISEEKLLGAWDDVATILSVVEADGGRSLTYFEVITVLGIVAFADAPVAVAAIEVGLGGTWDATNVVEGPVGVVMPVDLDHVDWLGHDIVAIAGEKAGILKPDMLAVIAQQDPEVAQVLIGRAQEVGSVVVREGFEFGVLDRQIAVGGQQLTLRGLGGEYDEVFLPLHGPHQAHNAACALVAVEGFLGGGQGMLDVDIVREGFANVSVPGRLEAVRRTPTVLVDVAHNPAGARALANAVADSFAFTNLVGVVAVLDDKDARGILAALEPLLSAVVITQSASPRCIPAEELGSVAEGIYGPDRVAVSANLPDALDRAVSLAESEGELAGAGVLVTGSVTLVGEARTLLTRL